MQTQQPHHDETPNGGEEGRLPLQLGDPVEHRGIVVTPLYPRRDPLTTYLTLDRALELGLEITEQGEAGRVPELAVVNPLDEKVLLYDGEELLGAKQNRILNLSVLIAPKQTLPIPVSCVEEGRWARQSDTFRAARHIAHSDLRRRKAETLAAQPLARGIAQGEVWDAVREKAARMRSNSPTGAANDIYRTHLDALRELEAAFPHQPGQCGAVLSLTDTHCLDHVSRPDAFRELYPKLLRGYLLDALEHLDRPPAPIERIAGFVDEIADAPGSRRPSAGLGEDLRLRGPGVIGSGLELDGELIQLSAYSSDTTAHHATGRINRPSRRRA